MRFEPGLETLYEEDDLPRFDLPEELERAHGPFGLADEVVFANFIASVDGVADVPGVQASSKLLSGGHPADRLTMALLRASADAVVVGAGTFRAHRGPWTAEAAYPDGAEPFAELRRGLGLAARPRQVVVSASGRLEDEAKMRDTLVLTTATGARTLKGVAVPGLEVEEIGETGPIDAHAVISLLRDRGCRRILTEGGPRLMGKLLEARAVDELFLTVSPVVAGGGENTPRPTFAAGVDLLPSTDVRARLRTVRRSESYLFLRYALRWPT
jgi:riboflavin biosynthesis pyrimidine reductase